MKEKLDLQVISPKEIDVLVASSIIPKGTPSEQIQVFARVCAEKNLSPFSRQIYLIVRNSKMGPRYTIQTGIDGYRALADRTKTYAGNDDYVFDEGLTQYQMLNLKRPIPTIAIATVYKIVGGMRVPFTASAEWGAYYPGDALGFMWSKMPYLMLGKCAEALAMRKAFPETLSGIYTDEEMLQADFKEIPKTEIKPETPAAIEGPKEEKKEEPPAEPQSKIHFEALRNEVRKHCGGKMSHKEAVAKLNELTGEKFESFPKEEKLCSILLTRILSGNGK
jgi:phage recombination protein Bet